MIDIDKLSAGPRTWRCSRCKRRGTRRDAPGWSLTYLNGRVVANVCPRCETPDEAAEADHNARTIDYSKNVRVTDGRWISGEAFTALNARAVEEEGICATDEYVENFGDVAHVGVLVGSCGSPPMGVALLFPWRKPVLEFVHNQRDGSESPLIDLDKDGVGEALVWLEVPLSEWLVLPRAGIKPATIQGFAQDRWREYIRALLVELGPDEAA